MVMVWLVGALSERMRTRGFWRSESELETQTGISRGLWHAKYMFFGQATSATFLVHSAPGPVPGGDVGQKQTEVRTSSPPFLISWVNRGRARIRNTKATTSSMLYSLM
jgi:hypothetical protein